MLSWIIRLFFFLSATITSWFVAIDELNFPIVQMVIAVVLFTILVFFLAFWGPIKNWLTKIGKSDK